MPSGDLSLHHEVSISQHLVYAGPSSFKQSSQPQGGHHITLTNEKMEMSADRPKFQLANEQAHL